MRLALVLVLALATPAAADPCYVRVLRAPDDVRAVVTHWLDAEQACSVDLVVRIIPTTGGLYVLAHGDDGKDRERIVPDAESAGVLIASWAADDTLPQDPDPIVHDEDDPAVAPPDKEVHVSVRPIEHAPPPPPSPGVWVALSGRVASSDGSGSARLDVDLARLDMGGAASISFGLTGGFSRSVGAVAPFADAAFSSAAATPNGLMYGAVSTRDLTGMVFTAFTVHPGRWHLRLQLGLGTMSTHADLDLAQTALMQTHTMFSLDSSSAIGELGGWVTHDVGARWRLGAGLVSASFNESFPVAGDYGSIIERHQQQTTLLATVQRAL